MSERSSVWQDSAKAGAEEAADVGQNIPQRVVDGKVPQIAEGRCRNPPYKSASPCAPRCNS